MPGPRGFLRRRLAGAYAVPRGKQNDTVEQLMDYQAILMMARREGVTSRQLLQRFHEAGITTLAVYDTTLERQDREGVLIAVPGAELRHAAPGSYGGVFDGLLASGSVRPDTVYVARGKDDTAWSETVEDLRLRYGTDRVHPVAGREDLLEILGDDRMLQVPDYRAKTPIMQAPLGLSTKELKEVHDAGFYAAVRPQNYLPVTEEAVRSLFRRIDASGAQVTLYVPAGTDVLGYPDKISLLGDALSQRNIRLGLLEHVTQLQFTKFEGLDPLLRAVDYNAPRIYNIDALENSKLQMPDALRRWALADEERNIRVNYLRPFNKPQQGVDIIDLNLSYARQITEQVKARGFRIGVATVLQNPYGPQVLAADGSLRRTDNGAAVFGGPYFPAKADFLVVALGAGGAGPVREPGLAPLYPAVAAGLRGPGHSRDGRRALLRARPTDPAAASPGGRGSFPRPVPQRHPAAVGKHPGPGDPDGSHRGPCPVAARPGRGDFPRWGHAECRHYGG